MRIVNNTFNIVIIGDWNDTYLEPRWLSEKVFMTDNFEIGLLGQGFNYKVQVNYGDFIYEPKENQVKIICTNVSEESIVRFEDICRSFFNEAFSPRIIAYGFNMQFEEDDTTSYSEIVDGIPIMNSLVENGAVIDATDIKTNLKYKDAPYNLTFSINTADKLNMTFNSECRCNCPSNEIDFDNNPISIFKSSCIELLNSCGYYLEEEE